MKIFRLFSLISVALIGAVFATFALPAPVLFEPSLAPLVFSVGVVGAATLLAIRHLILPTASSGRSIALRLAFPAPQTGEPPSSAFA